jgi:K+-transporting ATPase KdpF subunit
MAYGPSSLTAHPEKESIMSWDLLLAGAVAILLLAYLVVTMLFPEKF